MVDALLEAKRVLTPAGVLVDVRPVTEPIVVEVLVASQVVWAKAVATYSAPEENAAADAAVHHALSHHHETAVTSASFSFDIYCDTAEELRAYAEGRKLHGAAIPYEEIERIQRDSVAQGQPVRLRCRRPWRLSTYQKK